jgi:hypothetical protein
MEGYLVFAIIIMVVAFCGAMVWGFISYKSFVQSSLENGEQDEWEGGMSASKRSDIRSAFDPGLRPLLSPFLSHSPDDHDPSNAPATQDMVAASDPEQGQGMDMGMSKANAKASLPVPRHDFQDFEAGYLNTIRGEREEVEI